MRGTIADPKGAVVSRAEVTLANPNTGFSRTVKTNDQGVYQFLEIPPSTYSLTIKAPGFAAVRIEGVRLMVNTPATIDEVLKVQGGTTIVEVMDAAPLVNYTGCHSRSRIRCHADRKLAFRRQKPDHDSQPATWRRIYR